MVTELRFKSSLDARVSFPAAHQFLCVNAGKRFFAVNKFKGGYVSFVIEENTSGAL